MGRALLWLFAILIVICAVWYLWPAKADPAYWDEPEPPEMTGVLEPRGRLAQAEQIGAGAVMSSEDIAIGPDGAVYAGQPDGRLVRLRPGSDTVETVADVSNYPVLGLQWTPEGDLTAMAPDGLYRVNVATGESELLTNAYDGEPFGFGDDLDVADDGTIYFTDATSKWGAGSESGPDYVMDMVENRPWGALYAYHPDTGETALLLDDLYFANGVAMAADGRSVFVAETFRYRIQRYWLDGPNAGAAEIIAENLPGIPDGVMSDRQGKLYVAMDTQRSPVLAFLHENPFLTKMITKLPRGLWLRAGPSSGFVLVMNEEGDYLDSYHDPDGRFGMIANAVPEGEYIWIGSLTAPVIGRYRAPDRQ